MEEGKKRIKVGWKNKLNCKRLGYLQRRGPVSGLEEQQWMRLRGRIRGSVV